MSEIIEWVVSAGVLVLMAVVLFFYGIHARNRNFFYTSFLFLFLALCAGGWAGWIFIKKSYNKLDEIPEKFMALSGAALYEDMFDMEPDSCVRIHNSSFSFKHLSSTTFIEFSTCPASVREILDKNSLVTTGRAYTESIQGSEAPDWFKPEYLGEERITFKAANADAKKVLCISPDSSRALYMQVK